ncbi:MAG: hypothetical protein JST59_01310 [Actinobacteria bacterium]|nr:hypothetical protein [Actinomycetota bacterium]
MDTRGFEEDNVKGRNANVFLKKRVDRGGKLLLRRDKVTRSNFDWRDRDEHNTEKEQLNRFVKQLQTN